MNSLPIEQLILISSDIDDESPQVLGAFQEHALAAGALDCVLIPTQMKKGRPGVRVEILCRPEDRERFVALMLLETSTLGVRITNVERASLERRIETREVLGAPLRFKVAIHEGRIVRASPEFDDCLAIARSHAIPVREVLREANACALNAFPRGSIIP